LRLRRNESFKDLPTMSDSANDPLPWETTCQAVKARLDSGDDFLLVDCREPDEHALVQIKGATLVPMSQLTARVGELEPYRAKPIVVHCHHGGRSMRVTQWLRQQGFASVQSMAGGIDTWAVEIEPGLTQY
jgi:adenylyltransferase/sulfurtransferase